MDATTQNIPDTLIYEMADGHPIYYRGYLGFLNGTKKLEELMGSSYLQALIGTELIILLSQILNLEIYQIISNEIGLQFSKMSWRAADLAIFKKTSLEGIPLDNKYLKVAPEIVIEIDTKADLSAVKNPLGYYQEKTDELLAFGVKKVIWVFTETQKVLIADNQDDWQIVNWKLDIKLFPDIFINIQSIIDSKK